MNQLQTLDKVATLMYEATGGSCQCITQQKLRYGQMFELWLVGAETVAVHYFSDGGCMHYVQGHGSGWDVMATQLHQIAAKAV